MSNSDSAGGCLALLMLIGAIGSWVGSGVVAWNFTEPDSFGGAILFLIAWGVLGKVFEIIFTGIIAVIAGTIE